ncbi:MAG: hypothetical protein ACI395_04625 [Candidatus Cryptobacteroides sp.]
MNKTEIRPLYEVWITRNKDNTVQVEIPEESDFITGRLGRDRVVVKPFEEIKGHKVYCVPIRRTADSAVGLLKRNFPVDLLIKKSEEQEPEGKEWRPCPFLNIWIARNGNTAPRESNYLDSSIWNYCHWTGSDDTKDYLSKKTKVRVDRILESLYNNFEKEYYKTAHAVEYADLNARLLKQSYLLDDGGHGTAVVPFLFHSETKTREELEAKIKSSGGYCYGYKWRFLLLDDHANIRLKFQGQSDEDDEEKACVGKPNKLSVICDRLASIGVKTIFKSAKDKDWQAGPGCKKIDEFDIAIEYVTNLNDCKDAIKNKKYDIILLDYLLGQKSKYSPLREYSFELLKDIKFDNDHLKSFAGPGGRYYFMFISSYVNAVQERLENELLARSTKEWFIGRGACPMNTPEIFLYNLYVLMGKRANTMLDVKRGELDVTMQDLFSGENLDEKYRDNFVEILKFITAVQEIIKNDLDKDEQKMENNNKSVLARSIIEKLNIPTDAAFWEHLQHLCYMIAFESDSRWPEWWEEYSLIRKELENDEGKKKILEAIRTHIVKKSGIC